MLGGKYPKKGKLMTQRIHSRRKTVRIAAAIGALGASVALAACSGGTGQSGEASSGDQTVLTYLSWENEEVSQPLIDAFEAENPDIKVEFSFAPPVTEYIQVLQTRISGGQQPTLHRINPETKWTLIDEGLVRDLSDQPYIDKLADANKQIYTVDDKIYGASFGAWEAGIFYNKDLLGEVGVTEVPDTWDEFIDLCKKLQDADVKPYLESLSEMPRPFQGFLGAKYARENNTAAEQSIFEGNSTFKDEWTEVVSQWYRLYEEGIVGPETTGLAGDQVRDEFIAGNVAMYPSGPWDLAVVGESDVDFGIATFPGLEKEDGFGQGSPDPGFAISSSAEGKELEAAQRFIQFLASPAGLEQLANQNVMITAEGYETDVAPVYKDIYESGLRESKFYLCQDHWGPGGEALTVEAQAQFQLLAQGTTTPEGVGEAMDKKLASLQ